MNNDTKASGFLLPKRVTWLAHAIFILCVLGTIIYSFVVPSFGLSWGWLVIVIVPIWAFTMANISAG